MGGALRVGIIGTGRHGTRYATHILRDVPDLVLAAISRRSQEGFRQAVEWGVRHHPSWRDLVGDRGVDAVIAATTPDLNPAITEACAVAGKPLLLEKPMAVGVKEARGILEIAAGHGLDLTVAQTLRYNAVVLALREEIPRAGRLYSFSAHMRIEPSSLAWLEDPGVAGGGVILHNAVHLFDALRFITGREVTGVRAAMRQVHNPWLEDLFTALVEMEGGLTGTVDCSKVGPGRSGRMEFVGSRGQIHGDQVHGTLEFVSGLARHPLAAGGPVHTIVPLLRDWTAFLLGRCPNPISAREGLAAVRICEACRESALSGHRIDLGPDQEGAGRATSCRRVRPTQ